MAATGMLLAFRTDFADFPLDMGIIGREVLPVRRLRPPVHRELLTGPLDPGSDAVRRRPLGGPVRGHPWRQHDACHRAVVHRPVRRRKERDGGVREDDPGAQLPDDPQQPHPGLDPDRHRHVSGRARRRRSRPSARSSRIVASLLDGAVTDLQAGGTAFPFALPSGVRRLQHARELHPVQSRAPGAGGGLHRRLRGGADRAGGIVRGVPGPLALGVYMDYGTGAGDLANPLLDRPAAGRELRPSIAGDRRAAPGGRRRRWTSGSWTRSCRVPSPANNGLTSDLGWIRYPSPGTPIPIIKKEELILLRAEANIGLSDLRGGAAGHQPGADDVGQPAGARAPWARRRRRWTSCCTTSSTR